MENNVLFHLEHVLQNRQHADPKQSYTAQLFHAGCEKISKKLNEECLETILAATENNREHLIYESADLLFHLMVLLRFRHISLEEVFNELKRREGTSGITEKKQRSKP